MEAPPRDAPQLVVHGPRVQVRSIQGDGLRLYMLAEKYKMNNGLGALYCLIPFRLTRAWAMAAIDCIIIIIAGPCVLLLSSFLPKCVNGTDKSKRDEGEQHKRGRRISM